MQLYPAELSIFSALHAAVGGQNLTSQRVALLRSAAAADAWDPEPLSLP